jgi:hypothetical protein
MHRHFLVLASTVPLARSVGSDASGPHAVTRTWDSGCDETVLLTRGPRFAPPKDAVESFPLDSSEHFFSEKYADFCKCEAAGPNLCLECHAPPYSKHPDLKSVWVVVSEHMNGFLEASLRCNQALFDEVIVITSPGDNDTLKICESGENARCHATTALHLNGDPFNKGRALREVQQLLHHDADSYADVLIALVDNDICLPPDLWDKMPRDLQTTTLYTATKRCIFDTPDDYSRGWPAIEEHSRFETMGFFQMYRAHPGSPLYEDSFTSAGGDLDYAKKFGDVSRVDMSLNHMGKTVNWGGFKGDSTIWRSAKPPPVGACGCCPDPDFQ